MACGNGKISRGYLSSQPSAPPAVAPQHVRPVTTPPKKLPTSTSFKGPGSMASTTSDTSVNSSRRDWDMKGVLRYKGQWLSDMGAHVYFGGLDHPDGDGHGHGYIDELGNFTVFRDPYDPAGGMLPDGLQATPIVRRCVRGSGSCFKPLRNSAGAAGCRCPLD